MEAGRGQLYRENDVLLYLGFWDHRESRPERNIKKISHGNTAVYKGMSCWFEVIQKRFRMFPILLQH